MITVPSICVQCAVALAEITYRIEQGTIHIETSLMHVCNKRDAHYAALILETARCMFFIQNMCKRSTICACSVRLNNAETRFCRIHVLTVIPNCSYNGR